MQEKPTLIYIPPNVGGGTKGISVGGFTTIRNLIEAVAVFLSSILLMLFVKLLINVSFISWIIVFIGIILAFACVMGVNGEPMSIFFLNVASYNNRRIFVTLRPPMPKEKEKQVFGTGFEQKIQALVGKGEKTETEVMEKPEKPDKKKLRAEKKEAKEEARARAREEKLNAKLEKAEAKRAAQLEKLERKAAKKLAKLKKGEEK